ncbi:MAG: molybdopterin oxidoreductase [Candidatus Rokubacteria bacterium GWC2_70_16]|nr:MAG: molybdopterin oxidoreductase [Candidatus Rokubacteria bacterium GWC2_70_16]
MERRRFLQMAAMAGLGSVATPGELLAQYRFLDPVRVENPLAAYPNRDWERIYRDIFRHDRTFTFLCAPNDTHNCLLRGFVKNNVLVRIEPTYGYGKATDLSGNRASARWDPRCCQKGLVLGRRLYGDRRVKGAFVRKGFKEWVERGFPRDPGTGRAPAELTKRGWDSFVRLPYAEAYALHARALDNIARTYNAEQGKRYLLAQGYDPAMVDVAGGAGVRVMKFRGGMGKLGITRIIGTYRAGNMMALLDSHVRGVGPDKAVGGTAWDSYSWHTDLPPGHPMVTGDQTSDWELFAAEHANLIIVWGMNWITTKMPDSHWLTEARLKGTKVVVLTVEYSATANKGDEVIVIRPGTDPAFALGLASVIVSEKRYDADFVKRFTDLPRLIRMDNLQPLLAKDVFPGHKESELANWVGILKPGQRVEPTPLQNGMLIPEAMRGEFADFVMWDARAGKPVAVSRDHVGEHFARTGIDPALEGAFEVPLADGSRVQARTTFDLTRQYLTETMTPEAVSKITWAPVPAIVSLARQIAANPGKTLFPVGMGPNQFFNNDLKDRGIFLVAALTGNIGRPGGNVGSYAGNYRTSLFSGLPLYVSEDPFNAQLAADGPVSVKGYTRYESLHYYAAGEVIHREGTKQFTTGGHVPAPTKAIWLSNSNSQIANTKYHYNVVFNTLPRQECVVVNEWWWSGSCEYADIVYGVDSWMEFKYPDMTASNTNPFLQVFPRTPLRRNFGTVSDLDTYAGVAAALARLTGDRRFSDYWKFVTDNRLEVYLQRVLDASAPTKGYSIRDLEALAAQGIPALMNTRTYPRTFSWEQVHESKPWYTKTGRLEFYRPEPEFIEAGENMVVYREPVDSTFYDPNAIVARAHPAIRPMTPEQYGFDRAKRDWSARQGRNVVLTPEELLATQHPRLAAGYRSVFHTPKYRHGSHTTPIDTDIMSNFFGPFGDMYRRDRRAPHVGEAYLDISPEDARAMGVNDGDYVYVDGDPDDNPFKGWNDKGREAEYHVARLLCRARYYPGTPKGIMRMWHNGYMATPGSVRGHETRPDGLAKNTETNYQSFFRYGSHQSLTRSWLKPTHQTQGLVTRRNFSHEVTRGFQADVHCVTGAPREAMCRVLKAEDGGIGGKGLWRPVTLGLRPTNESAAMKQYLGGAFIVRKA